MKEITDSLLKECAKNIMIELNDEEFNQLKEDFIMVSDELNKIGKIEGLDDAKPMTFPFDVTISYLREDEPVNKLTRDEALSNAKDVLGGQIRLPKVVK